MTQAVSGCCRSASATRSGSTGWPHSKSSDTALMPNALQMLTHRAAKWPAFRTSALPPGGTALTAAASIAPVPEAVRIRTSFCVRKTSLSPAATSVITSLASADRWWITGRASSSSTSSGTIAGPGVINRGLRISAFPLVDSLASIATSRGDSSRGAALRPRGQSSDRVAYGSRRRHLAGSRDVWKTQ